MGAIASGVPVLSVNDTTFSQDFVYTYKPASDTNIVMEVKDPPVEEEFPERGPLGTVIEISLFYC